MDDHLVLGTWNAKPLLNGPKGTLELCVLERHHRPALLADEMVVVLAGAEHHLIRSNAGHLDPPDQPVTAQKVERPVDAGHPDPAAALAQTIVDLLRVEQAVLIGEELHHLIAGTAGPRP